MYVTSVTYRHQVDDRGRLLFRGAGLGARV